MRTQGCSQNVFLSGVREAAKKLVFLVARPLKGEGGKGPATKEKKLFENIYMF